MMTSYGRVPDLLRPSRCCLLHFHVSMSPCLTSCCERLHMVTMSGDIQCLLAGKDHPSDLLKPASLLLLRPFLPTMRLVCNFTCSCAFACPSPGSIPCCKQSFTPLANHAELTANLAPVQTEPLGVHATTRSRNAVTFADTAMAHSYAPDDRPRQVSTAPSTAVPLQGATVSMTAGPARPPAQQPSGARHIWCVHKLRRRWRRCHTCSPSAAGCSLHESQIYQKKGRKKSTKSTITSSDSPPATSDAPHPTAGTEVHPAKLATTSGKSNRRPTLQADRGDVCDESDSDKLARRRS